MSIKYPPIVQVDENGKVIGPVKYKIAHPENENHNGVRHSTVNVMIFKDNSYRKVLLQKRGKEVLAEKGRYDCSAGGHIDWLIDKNMPDTPKDAVLKEINEELFSLKGIPKTMELGYIGAFNKELALNDKEFLYLVRGICQGPFSLYLKEVSELKWEDVSFLLIDLKNFPGKYTKNLGFCLEKCLDRI